MPSAIDVMIWNDVEATQILAVPVSVPGRRFLEYMTHDREVTAVIVELDMGAFLEHVPPTLRVFFNRDDGQLIALVGKNPLQ